MQWLKKEMKWIIRDSQTIQVWEDHWILGDSLRSHIVDLLMPNKEQRLVTSLWDNHIWRLEGLQIPLPMQFKQLIKGILVAQLTKLSDSFIWAQNNGVCLVKFLYQQANVPFNNSMWNWIWKFHCPKKIQFFIWKSMLNRLPTRQYLAFSRPDVDDHCPRCNTLETTIHISRDCPWAKMI